MVAKPHLQDGGFERAGLPLARAQRLNRQSGAAKKNGRAILFAVAAGVVFAGGVVAVLSGGPDAMPQTAPVEVASTTNADVEEPTAPEAVQFTKPVTVTYGAAPVVASSCLGRLERALGDVYDLRGAENTWPAKQEGLRSLLQTGLGCDDARVEMSGNFEIARGDLGSVSVKWNPVNRVLRLTVVDSGTDADHPTILDETGRPVAFVVK